MTIAHLKVVESVRACTKCKVTKPTSDFYPRSNRASGLTSACKACYHLERKPTKYNPDRARQNYKKWRKSIESDPVKYAKYLESKNKFSRSEKYFEAYYKKRFGISFSEVTAMLSRQNGLCANIGCSKQITLLKDSDIPKACVDHCHATGKVRALLCVRCNTTLGHIENHQNLIPGLMDYLAKHKSGH